MPYLKHLLAILLLGVLLTGCPESHPPRSGIGMRPIYVDFLELENIENLPPQSIENSGSIFLLDTLFFMLEQGKGIHVYGISDPTNARGITFIKIPAITAFTVSNNRLYADSWRDLVSIDISNLLAVQVLSRQLGVFEPLLYPPLYSGIFECVDENKGAVAGWEESDLEAANCRTL